MVVADATVEAYRRKALRSESRRRDWRGACEELKNVRKAQVGQIKGSEALLRAN